MLDFKILDNRAPDNLFLYNKAYGLWKSGWGKAFEEQKLKGIDTNNSNGIFFADKIGLVLDDGDPIGFCLYTFLNFKNKCHTDLEYIQAYPDEGVKFLSERYSKIMAMSYLFIDEKYRGKNLAYYTLASSISFFLESGEYEALISMPLVEQGVQKICTNLGMLSLHPEKRMFKHDVEVEFNYLTKSTANYDVIRESLNQDIAAAA